MDIGLSLALETLTRNPDPILLCRCMQTIARQGSREHILLLSGYISDPTIVFRRRYRGIGGGEVQVGDVAAAAIAFLSSVPVTEIGFAEPAEHETFGIIYEELVVPQKPLTGEEKADEDQTDGAQGERERMNQAPFGPRPKTLREIQQLKRESERRAAARIEIHLKAMELVPAAPLAPPGKS